LYNKAGTGGGVCAQGPASITDCIFVGNLADSDDYGGHGGGLAACGTDPAVAVNCVVVDCESMNLGGAIYVSGDSSLQLVNCTLSGNRALDGSGVYAEDTGLATLQNSIIAHGSSGGAAAGTGDVQLAFSNMFGNAGGDWVGPAAGQLGTQGNISDDPLFVAPESFDLHLRHDSPCRDSGDSSYAGLPVNDCEGDPRVVESGVDMGADEFYSRLYHMGDVVAGSTVRIRIVGDPQAPVILAWGQKLLDPPVPTQHGDCHIWPFVWSGYVGLVPSNGVLILPLTISTSWSPGGHAPLQALIGPWGGGATRLTNLDVVRVE